MRQLSIKNSNRILCVSTVVMIAVQFLLAFIGIYDTLTMLLVSQVSLILISFFGIWLSDVNMKEVLRIRPINLRTFVFAFFMVFCSFPIVALLNAISMLFVENAVVDAATDMYRYGLGLSLFVMAVLPAIGEELLVRGVIYHSYREKSPVLAWVLSAAIFGMLHMNFNQMPYAIYLGIVMVLMVEASDSIVTSMCMHFFVNGISTLSGYFSAEEMAMLAEEGFTAESVVGTGDAMVTTLMGMSVLSLIMIPLIVFILIGTCRVNHRSLVKAFRKAEPIYDRYALPEVQDEVKIIDIWFVIAVLIMVVITGFNTFA